MKTAMVLSSVGALALGVASVRAAESVRLAKDMEVGFRMEFGSAADKKPAFAVREADMDALACSTDAVGRIVAEWRGHEKAGAAFAVRATFMPADGGWLYRLSYSGNASGLDIESIRFPVVEVPCGERAMMVVPNHTGSLRKAVLGEPGSLIRDSGTLCVGTRFAAVLDEEGTSYYLDLRGDARKMPTSVAYFTGHKPNTIRYSGCVALPCAEDRREAGELPYGGLIRPFAGGWFAAADIYRQYVWSQDWYKSAVANRRPHLRDVGLWLWNRGWSQNVTGAVDRIRRDTGVKIALDWYWWHVNPYGRDAPYYWPTREPLETFKGTVQALRAKGVYVQNYINGMGCDVKHPEWSDADWAETMVRRDGSYWTKTWNKFFNHPTAMMCGEAPVFHERMSYLVRNLAACGVNCVYIDLVDHWVNYACWSTRHAHPRGAAINAGYHRMMDRVGRENPCVDISSESVTESLLDVVDSMIVLYADFERMSRGTALADEYPPIYQSVYHTAVTMYGSHAILDNVAPWDDLWPDEFRRTDDRKWLKENYPDQFAIELTRPVVFGLQPMVHQLLKEQPDDPACAADYRYLVDTVKFYYANRDYLYDGIVCDPGKIVCATKSAKLLTRTIYAANGDYPDVTNPAVPTVMHAVWKAPDGRIAAVLANWTREGQDYALETSDGKSVGTLPARTWKLVRFR